MSGGRFRPLIQEAALALELGWDPIAYLGHEGVERLVARAVLQEALETKADSDSRFWKNMASSVQNGIVKAFGGSG